MRSRPLFLLGALVALAGAAVLAWLPRDAGPAPAPDDAGGEAPAATAGPLLSPNDREAAEGYHVEDGVAVPRERVSDAPGPAVVVVRVVDDEARPVPGRTVRAAREGVELVAASGSRPAYLRSVREPLRSRRTDASGLVRWTGLRSGVWVRVRVDADERWSDAEAYVMPGSPLTTLAVSALAPCTIHVHDEGGRPVPDVSVVLYAPSRADGPSVPDGWHGRIRGPYPLPAEQIAHAAGDGAGRATLPLRPAVRGGQLSVTARGFAPWLDRAWKVGDTQVRLDRSREIEGVVRDTKGSVVADGYVVWETAQGIRGESRVEYDGTFLVGDLPSGVVRLEWRLAEAPTLDGVNVANGTPGRGTVTLVVDRGGTLTVRIEGWPREPGGQATLTPQDDTRPDPPLLRAEVDVDGAARFDGLTPERRYVLWAPARDAMPWEPGSESRAGFAYRRDVLASEETLVVPYRSGRTVRGVIDLTGTGGAGPATPTSGPWREVTWVGVRGLGLTRGGSPGEVDPKADAREIPFTVTGVPEGELTATVAALIDRDGEGPDDWTHWVGEAPVPSGDEPVRIRLRPAPAPGEDVR